MAQWAVSARRGGKPVCIVREKSCCSGVLTEEWKSDQQTSVDRSGLGHRSKASPGPRMFTRARSSDGL